MVSQPQSAAPEMDNLEVQESGLKWTSVSIQEVSGNDNRLEASYFGIAGRLAREDLKLCKWEIVPLGKAFIEQAFYLGRFRRIYVDKRDGEPFFLPSQMTEIDASPTRFISPATPVDLETTRVRKGQVLLTRSGTIGEVSYVSQTFENRLVSDDVIRVSVKEFPGYVYAYFKSEFGNYLVNTNNYGAVVKHIEPDHLDDIPIPNPSPFLKQHIHNLIQESFQLRDESNRLIAEAQAILRQSLELPHLDTIRMETGGRNEGKGVLSYSVPLNKLEDRLDGSYHVPLVDAIERHIKDTAKEILRVGDSRISESVIMPGRFTRIYVGEGHGVTFLGGKRILELDPSNKKYLSKTHHRERIEKQLSLQKNTTLITCSGTIGKVAIVPEHWEGWTASQHVIRVVPQSDDVSGYVFAWLSSDYAHSLICRYAYGATVDEITDRQVSDIVIPLLRSDDDHREINENVLVANKKRTEAYHLEQEALRILNEKVIYAR